MCEREKQRAMVGNLMIFGVMLKRWAEIKRRLKRHMVKGVGGKVILRNPNIELSRKSK